MIIIDWDMFKYIFFNEIVIDLSFSGIINLNGVNSQFD